MGEEEDGGGDGIGYLHHTETYKALYGIKILQSTISFKITGCLD